MAISAFTGPLIAFTKARNASTGLGVAADNNPMGGPSSFQDNYGMGDNRAQFAYVPGQNDTHPYLMWLNFGVITLDITPATLNTAALAALQTVTSGTPMTLISSAGNGIIVGASTTNFLTGAKVSGLLAVGQASGMVGFGQLSPQSTNVWDPTSLTARVLSITAAASATGGTFTIAGYDIYGYPMHEQITAAASSTVDGKKAWKYIASVTPGFTDSSHDYSVGTTDLYGFPIYNGGTAGTGPGQYALIWYPAPTLLTSTGTLVAGLSLASTSTYTTADVRGTFTLPSASNGTNRLTIVQGVSVADQANANGVYGVAQF